ncbi:MAG: hypothetical protein ACFFAO_06420 [Candidatus Hermodarchaeota archaeon]
MENCNCGFICNSINGLRYHVEQEHNGIAPKSIQKSELDKRFKISQSKIANILKPKTNRAVPNNKKYDLFGNKKTPTIATTKSSKEYVKNLISNLKKGNHPDKNKVSSYLEMELPKTYYCSDCGHRHRTSSKIGLEHYIPIRKKHINQE